MTTTKFEYTRPISIRSFSFLNMTSTMRKRDENTYTNKPRTCRKSVRIESESKAVYSFSSGISSVNAKIKKMPRIGHEAVDLFLACYVYLLIVTTANSNSVFAAMLQHNVRSQPVYTNLYPRRST